MKRTRVDGDHKRIVPGRAIGYSPRGNGWEIEMWPWEQTGDGAVLTTVLDLAKWDANFSDPKVGGQPLVDGLLTRGKLENGTVLDYAAGLVHATYRGQPTVWHNGGWAGYGSQLERFPALEASVIVLCNTRIAEPELLARRIADVVLEKHLRGSPTAAGEPPRTIQLTTAELDAWVATYREAETGELIVVERAGDKLEVAEAGERYVLAPTTGSTFRLGDTPFVLHFEGTAPRRRLVAKAYESYEAKFAEVEIHEPTARELVALAGRYRSDEVDTEWKFAMSGGKLVATGRAFDEPAVLAPATKDEYTIMAIGAQLRFTRDKRRRITGFALSTGGTHGIRFDRVR